MDASSILFVCCNPERLVFGTSKELFTLFYFIHLSRWMQQLYILCLTEAVSRDSLFQNLVSQCFQIGTSKWMPPFQQSRETYAHIMSVEEIWLQPRLSTLPLPQFDCTYFSYGISIWDVASYDKYLSQIDKFQKRAVRLGFFTHFKSFRSLR